MLPARTTLAKAPATRIESRILLCDGSIELDAAGL
jgi:hypothetical protein